MASSSPSLSSPPTHHIFRRADLLDGSDEQTLRRLAAAFPEELERVKRAYALSTPRASALTTPSPSQLLYGAEYPEVNRTLVGALSLKWILNGDYQAFAGGQSEAVRLTPDAFQSIRDVFAETIVSDDHLHTLVVCIVCNDLGKDPELVADYARATGGTDISKLNHDMILYRAITAGLVPAYKALPASLRDDVLRGMRLSSEFNFGQLAQAENVPANLRGLVRLQDHPAVVSLRFLEIVLDVAGAAGHGDWSCAKVMTKPVWQAYLAARRAAVLVNTTPTTKAGGSEAKLLRHAYDRVLTDRIELLLAGLDDNDDDDLAATQRLLRSSRALARILCMGAVSDTATLRLYREAWQALDDETRAALDEALERDGTADRPAVMVAYSPALFRSAAANGADVARETRLLRVQAAMRYLARALVLDAQLLVAAGSGRRVVVQERDIRLVIESAAFKKDPCSLEEAEIPRATVALTEEEEGEH